MPVVLRRQPDLVHGFVNMIGLAPRCREAVAEAAGALRAGLTFTKPNRACVPSVRLELTLCGI